MKKFNLLISLISLILLAASCTVTHIRSDTGWSERIKGGFNFNDRGRTRTIVVHSILPEGTMDIYYPNSTPAWQAVKEQ